MPCRHVRILRDEMADPRLDSADMGVECADAARQLDAQEGRRGVIAPVGEGDAFIDGGATGADEFVERLDDAADRRRSRGIEPCAHQRERAGIDGIGFGEYAARFGK